MLKLDTPLRITWNALALPDGEATLSLVGERLITAQALEVSVRLRPGALSANVELFGRIATQARLELVLDADAPDAGEACLGRSGAAGCEEEWASSWNSLGTLATQAPGRVAVVWECTPGAGIGLLRELPALPPGVQASVAACPDADNLRAVVDLARGAAQRGIRRVNLTHPDLAGRGCGGRDRCLTAYHLRRLLADEPELLSLATEFARVGCELSVHDLFLNRALLGAWPTGYRGCQAGAAMAHVDGAGNVYPCSALPVALGNLSSLGLDEIWAQRERVALRSLIETPGPLCAACEDYPICRGGCRGLSYVITGSWERADPACPRHGSSS